MSVEKVDAAIIGAGVVGAAVAQKLAQQGLGVCILEQGPRIAEGVTSRNSGVIHAGIYYPPNSIKAQSCIRGSAILYQWAKAKGVPFKNTGKLIVGKRQDQAALEELFLNAVQSGARDLQMIQSADFSSYPLGGISGDLGIWSPKTGIIDPYALTRSLIEDAESNGALLLTSTDVLGASGSSGNFRLHTSRGDLEAERVVNATGLSSDKISQLIAPKPTQIYPWKGCYYRIQSLSSPPSTLVYPVKKKNAPGLGVHLTLGLDGSIRLGPDVELVSSRDDFSEPLDSETRKLRFYQSASEFLPQLRPEQLSFDSAGIRPKLRSPQDAKDPDFFIAANPAGWVDLIGIESPGLTASLDIADRVAALL